MRGIKRGALVVLRSGGPEMVIDRIDSFRGSPERYATCKWFDKLRPRSERFGVHVLELCAPAVADLCDRALETEEPTDAGLDDDAWVDALAEAAEAEADAM